MSLKIRLARAGAKKRPFYRIVIADSRSPVPEFMRGKAAEGVGSPHVGLTSVWPMSIAMRALTSQDEAEIRQCLRWLSATTAGTGFMHESFDKDDPAKFTRPWFAWANTLFGELVVRMAAERPALFELASTTTPSFCSGRA